MKTWAIYAEVINGWPYIIFLRRNASHWVKVTIAEILIAYLESWVKASSSTLGIKITHTMTSKIGFSTASLPAINVI